MPGRLRRLRGRLPHRGDHAAAEASPSRSIWAAASSAPSASRRVPPGPSPKPATIAWRCAAAKTSCWATPGKEQVRLAAALDEKLRRLFGRSLKLRQVSAGGCNACEADTNVLGTIGWDLGRFGIQFVASPRHADGLLITGPVSKNMELALKKTYAAVPEPKIVIAVGACAIAGGPFVGSPQVLQWRRRRGARGPVHPRLSAASADHPRRACSGCWAGWRSRSEKARRT